MTSNSLKALILLLPGFGDAMVASPLIREMAQRRPQWQLHAMSMLPPVKEFAHDLGVFTQVHHVPLLSMSSLAAWRELIRLRRNEFDLVVLPYPAGRWQYHAVARVVASGKVVTHQYPSFRAALVNRGGVPLSGQHRVAENLQLLKPMGIAASDATEDYFMPASWRSMEKSRAIAIHPGSMRYKGNEVRRWPIERFLELLHKMPADKSVYVVAGPSEREDAEWLVSNGPPRTALLEGAIADVARKLSECSLLVSNDSGIAHLGAGLGVPTIVLFGMSKPQRALPPGAIAVRPSSCPPCFDEFAPTFECARRINYKCIRQDLEVSHVINAIAGLRSM